MEFIQAAYNVHEHNHADETLWPKERLEARLEDINYRMANIGYTGIRLAQNEREKDLLAFELTSRYKDSKVSEEDEAWLGRNEMIGRL